MLLQGLTLQWTLIQLMELLLPSKWILTQLMLLLLIDIMFYQVLTYVANIFSG